MEGNARACSRNIKFVSQTLKCTHSEITHRKSLINNTKRKEMKWEEEDDDDDDDDDDELKKNEQNARATKVDNFICMKYRFSTFWNKQNFERRVIGKLRSSQYKTKSFFPTVFTSSSLMMIRRVWIFRLGPCAFVIKFLLLLRWRVSCATQEWTRKKSRSEICFHIFKVHFWCNLSLDVIMVAVSSFPLIRSLSPTPFISRTLALAHEKWMAAVASREFEMRLLIVCRGMMNVNVKQTKNRWLTHSSNFRVYLFIFCCNRSDWLMIQNCVCVCVRTYF